MTDKLPELPEVGQMYKTILDNCDHSKVKVIAVHLYGDIEYPEFKYLKNIILRERGLDRLICKEAEVKIEFPGTNLVAPAMPVSCFWGFYEEI